MSFLDRFKIQPRHKSTDPEVRIAGVAELGLTGEDADALVALAREDADPRVRRAAAARIEDAGVLAALAGNEQDPAIREDLQARLAAIAAVAKTSPVDSVRAAAVGRLTDARFLSSVARHATDPRTAALAADRIEDPG